ncbi:Fpg/Nei family DNA glycosylase [Nocardioides sp. Kera G14]|uniref:Fpg/Nei family DNA glycosylase n=1 Tax=Nocardioides sp. Kera G14 TaxID=2884264 RepID=UPI001D120599|nr:DNA-formamidopyrimidine glycosylase family protein [Nocardioides sp. Kera G14]UDY24479.1 Fpg/Nei family DNA glycosylase [Nocardioides sp. Kera G14]
MPEGHTLHRLALDLTEAFAGQHVRVGSPQGRFDAEARQLDGALFEGAEAWGKQLFLRFEGERFVHIHLGLYGKLALTPYVAPAGEQGPPAPVGQVRLRLVGDRAFADLRGATACDLWTPAQVEACVAKLGPDPLRDDADPDRAWARISRTERTLASLLMDQSVLAGVGNVYRAELLHRHRLDPHRPGRSLRKAQWQAMWEDLVALMRLGVERNRIDTVRPEHEPEAMGREPRRDDHGGEVYVYRRTGQPCLVCGAAVRTVEVEGRNLFWCPRCQRPYRSRTGGSQHGGGRR